MTRIEQGAEQCGANFSVPDSPKRVPPIAIAVLAHHEERRIAACLRSLPLGDPDVAVHVVVNGSTDRTAAIAQQIADGADNVRVHVYPEGGKSRSWNRFVFDDLPGLSDTHIFVDGDAELAPGSVAALVRCLDENPEADAASGLPLNGRNAAAYRDAIVAQRGLFGDLYALRGSFLARMRARGLRLPEDAVGDDELIAMLVKTDFGRLAEWDDGRIAPCLEAGFLCEQVSMLRPTTLRIQYRRMINYSVRHFQNRIVAQLMRAGGPDRLPRRFASLYGEWLPRLAPRRDPARWWFDRLALARMARASRPAVPPASAG